MLGREMPDRPSKEALTRGQDVKQALFVLLLSFISVPLANAQSGQDGESETGRPASYVSAGYHHLSQVYRSEYLNETKRFPIGVYAEYGYNLYKRYYILASVNFNHKSEPLNFLGTIVDDRNNIMEISNYNFTYVQNIVDLKTGFKYHWELKFTSIISFYIAAQVGVEFRNARFVFNEEEFDDDVETFRSIAASMGPGMYFKLHPSVWVDIAAGYRKVFDSRRNRGLGGRFRYPYVRIGVVYPFGYR